MEQEIQQKQTQASKRLVTENKKLREKIAELEKELKTLREFVGIGEKK